MKDLAPIQIDVRMRRDPRDFICLLALVVGVIALLWDTPGWPGFAARTLLSFVVIALGLADLWEWMVRPEVPSEPLKTDATRPASAAQQGTDDGARD